MSRYAFLYRMPSGIPGMTSRGQNQTIEPVPLDPARAFSAYGLFGAISNGKFVPLSPVDTPESVYGLLTKPYPTSGTEQAMGEARPPLDGIANVMRRGYATVLLRAGTASLNSQVYVRINSPLPNRPIGGIEAVADGTNTIAITRCTFMSGADAEGNVEIAYNI